MITTFVILAIFIILTIFVIIALIARVLRQAVAARSLPAAQHLPTAQPALRIALFINLRSPLGIWVLRPRSSLLQPAAL